MQESITKVMCEKKVLVTFDLYLSYYDLNACMFDLRARSKGNSTRVDNQGTTLANNTTLYFITNFYISAI